MTLQKLHIGRNEAQSARLLRTARKLTPQKRTAYTAPVTKAWKRQVKRVRAGRNRTERIRLIVGASALIIAANAVIATIVILIRRVARMEEAYVEDEKTGPEMITTREGKEIPIEDRESVRV